MIYILKLITSWINLVNHRIIEKGVTQVTIEQKPPEKDKVALNIEISNSIKDRVDEILETGDFTNMSDLVNYAILHFIPDYERSRNEYLSDKLGELEQYL